MGEAVHNLKEQAWYALYVRPNCERLVAAGLDQLHVQGFLPTYKERCGRKDHFIWVEKPLFPGYLFCNLDLKHGPKLYQLPGIIRFVSSGKLPSQVGEDEIESIRRISDSNMPVSPCPFLVDGDEVVVIEGPLKGIAGIYVQAEKMGNLVVSLHLLGRSIRVRFDSQWVKPLRHIPRIASYIVKPETTVSKMCISR
jgi:transcription antitermination factor NusG